MHAAHEVTSRTHSSSSLPSIKEDCKNMHVAIHCNGSAVTGQKDNEDPDAFEHRVPDIPLYVLKFAVTFRIAPILANADLGFDSHLEFLLHIINMCIY